MLFGIWSLCLFAIKWVLGYIWCQTTGHKFTTIHYSKKSGECLGLVFISTNKFELLSLIQLTLEVIFRQQIIHKSHMFILITFRFKLNKD